MPSATYALRVGLQVIGVQRGDEVLCAAIDWPSGFAAITRVGQQRQSQYGDRSYRRLAALGEISWRGR
jgi:hypothetical protein